MILELKDVNKIYTNGEMQSHILFDINFSVNEGDFVSIMGPSGSGKSTLMNIIGCLDRLTSGQYLFEGEDVAKLNDDELSDLRNRGIGFIFQQFNLLPKMTALENVELPLVYAGVKPEERKVRALELLDKVGLKDKFDRFPTQMSGGQKQRVAVARALINNPRIILADEPTGALDSKNGEQLMQLFKELNAHGTTIIMITHERGVAMCASKIYEIVDGRLSPLKHMDVGGIK